MYAWGKAIVFSFLSPFFPLVFQTRGIPSLANLEPLTPSICLKMGAFHRQKRDTTSNGTIKNTSNLSSTSHLTLRYKKLELGRKAKRYVCPQNKFLSCVELVWSVMLNYYNRISKSPKIHRIYVS